MMSSAWRWIRYNPNLAGSIAISVLAVVIFLAGGCASKTQSPFSGQDVTRDQLMTEHQQAVVDFRAREAALQRDYNADVAALQVKYDSQVAELNSEAEQLDIGTEFALADLDQQDQVKLALWEFAAPYIDAATMAAFGVGGISTLIGIALKLDSRKKDRKIQDQREELQTLRAAKPQPAPAAA